jgi:hypothetical protein
LFPSRSLDPEQRTLAAELANHAFLSTESASAITEAGPASYLATLEPAELAAHCIPNDPRLFDPANIEDFLSARRVALAMAMNELLDHFEPEWVRRLPDSGDANEPALSVVHYGTAWDPGVLRFVASGPGLDWTGLTDAAELEATISAVADTRITSDVEIGGSGATVDFAEDDTVTVAIGPFDVAGHVTSWRELLTRRRRDARAPGRMPETPAAAWTTERTPLDVTVCR